MMVTFVDEHLAFGGETLHYSVIPSFTSSISNVPTMPTGDVVVQLDFLGDFNNDEDAFSINIEGYETGLIYSALEYVADTVTFTISKAIWETIVADGTINISYNLGINTQEGSRAYSGVEEYLRLTFAWEVWAPPPNAAPRFTGPSELSIAENQFLIAPLAADDPDGDALSYTIAGGDDAALFTIDAATGALSFIQAPNFEAPGSAAGSNDYQVRVEVSDGALSDTKLFKVSVTDADDEIVGTLGNDVFHATDAFEHFLGDDGRDTVIFTGTRDSYTIDVRPDGTITVGYGNGIDTLSSIERLQFDDGTLAFDFNGTAGQAYRLYQAAFDRAPDSGGLGYWIDYLDEGKLDVGAVADRFMDSAEFIRLYGIADSISNADYIELLYQNALGRSSDTSGFAYWLSQLDSEAVGRGHALAIFTESPESIAYVLPSVSDGIWFT